MLSQEELIQRDELARERALDVCANILCAAPAGSGKTELLIQRALACLSTATHPEEVLLLTFTTKAASEIQERLVAALSAANGPEPEAPHARRTWRLARAVAARDAELGWQLVLNPGRLRTLTLDALNKLIADQAPIASGMGGSTQVKDDPKPIYRDAVLALIDEINVMEDETKRAALTIVLRMAQNRSENLVEVLSKMLAKRDQWLGLVLSGEHFDAEAVVRPIIEDRLERVDAMISGSLRDPLMTALRLAGKIDDDLTTWPDTRAESLRAWFALAESIITKKPSLRVRVTAREGFPAGTDQCRLMNEALSELGGMPHAERLVSVLHEIVSLLPPLELLGPVENLCQTVGGVLARLVAHLNLAFIRAGGIDFQEVAQRALAALGDASGTSPLLERLDYRIRHILLDEAQDTSSVQYELLAALTLGWEPDDGRSLFIVGDPQQSIYAFREAEVRLFMEMWESRQFGNIPLECVTLSRNFRSDTAVIDWCNRVFSRVFPEVGDVYIGSVTHTPSLSVRGEQGGSVTAHWFRGNSNDDEAIEAAGIIRKALNDRPDQSIAILARNRKHVVETMETLKDAGIRVACKDIDPLSETPAVRDVVGLIRALWHEQDRVSWGVVLRAPFVGLSYSDLLAVTRGQTYGSLMAAVRERVDLPGSGISEDGQARLRRLLQVLDTALADADLVADLHDLATAVWIGLDGPACVTANEAEDVRSTFRLLREHLTGGRLNDLREFLAGLSSLYASGEPGTVQVMTMHAAKGLEFDTVLLLGLGRKNRKDDDPVLAYRHTREGTLMVPLPGYRGSAGHKRLYDLAMNLNKQAGEYEQLRLLYVACTRARDHLHLICSIPDNKNLMPHRGSLLHSLWPALAGEVDPDKIPISQPRARGAERGCPISPRLRSDWTRPAAAEAYVPAVVRTLRPSELAVRGELEQADEETGIVDRLVGTAFHETMAFLLDRGMADRFEQLLDRIVPPMRSGLRRRGMPEPELDRSVERVLTLVRTTLSSEDGQAIIRRREEEGNEYRLTGFIDGEWISAAIDRYYVEDDTCWVVDYKAGGDGLTGAALDRFVTDETRRYQPQVRRYMDLMSEARGIQVRGGLFFAAAGRFVEI